MIQNILERLEKVKQTSSDTWRCQCPCGHKSPSQMALKELPDGRVLIHCFAGHSPAEIMQAIDMSLNDLFEEPIDQHIQPLYMARKEKLRAGKILDRVKSCQLRLEMADEMRERGIRLTDKDLQDERQAFIELKRLQQGSAA